MEFRHCLLKDDLPRQLHLAGVVDGGGDHAKVLAILQLFGTPHTGWLKALNASIRSCNFMNSDTGNSRKIEASRFL